MTNNLLLLLDTFYFLHRSFHSYPKDLKNSKGIHTNVVFGLAQTILDSLSEFNPSYIACGWESEELPSFRKDLYKDYQKTRVEMEPDDLRIFRSQLPLAINLLDAFNIPRLMENGFEGDDVVGTAAFKASKEVNVIIATSDQDLLQLINERINVFRPARPPFVHKQIFNTEEFIKKYKFSPDKMIDYKALRGDPSDNIPGVKGIGEKIATELIAKYGSIEDIYQNLNSIESVSVRKKLEIDRDKAFLSKQLATIITDIPMHFDLKKCEVHDFDIEKIRELFEEYEFRSLNKKLERLITIKGIKDKLQKDKKMGEQMGLI